jgi:hypothetical protein
LFLFSPSGWFDVSHCYQAPLLMGADPTNLTKHALSVLTNPAVVAINQDAMGVQGSRLAVQRPSARCSRVWSDIFTPLLVLL